jgi:hypothetical protein
MKSRRLPALLKRHGMARFLIVMGILLVLFSGANLLSVSAFTARPSESDSGFPLIAFNNQQQSI